MNLLANPVVLQLVGLGLVIGAMFVMGFLLLRSMRKSMSHDMAAIKAAPRTEAADFALTTYQAVIGGLKKSESELKAQLATENNRIKAQEMLHSAILENISTGVLMFGPNLLVQEANTAARKLLGYASPASMHARELFRGMRVVDLPTNDGPSGGLVQAIHDVFASSAEYRDVPATYSTPAGEQREFQINLLPVMATGQQVTLVICLIQAFDPTFTLSFPPSGVGRNTLNPE